MAVTYSVCIQGFSSFESETFEAFFRLAARRAPSYRCVGDLALADIVIADAGQTAMLEAVTRAGKLHRTLTVGHGQVPGAAAGITRPINMMALLRMLDELAGSMSAHPAAQTAAAPHGGAAAPVKRVAHATGSVPHAAAANDHDAGAMHILVVDDSDVALRFMQARLRRLGFEVSLANSGDEALRMLEQRQYAFVFLDVMMAGLDGFQTCKRIKQKEHAAGEPPRVIMLTSKGGPIDKLRGTLAGCDGYLVKPLDELRLVKLLAQLDPAFMARFGESAAA